MNCGVKKFKPMFLSVSVILSGLNLVESYPYETVQRQYDYVRLASITAGRFNDVHWLSPYFIPLYSMKMFCSSQNIWFQWIFPGSMPKQNRGALCFWDRVTQVLPFIWIQSRRLKLQCLHVVGWQPHSYPRLILNNIIRECQWILMLSFFFFFFTVLP